jgi:hypothetical protein
MPMKKSRESPPTSMLENEFEEKPKTIENEPRFDSNPREID